MSEVSKNTQESWFGRNRTAAAQTYWFMSDGIWHKFLAFFGVIYLLGSTVTLSATSGIPVWMAFAIALTGGAVLSITVLKGAPNRIGSLFENKNERKQHLEIDYDGTGGSGSSLRDARDEEDGENEESKVFQHKKRVEFLNHSTKKTRDDFIKTSFNVFVGLIAFALLMNGAYGLPPAAAFLVSLPVLLILWITNVFILPRIFVYILLFAIAGVRIGAETFGMERIMMLLPNFLMLPIFYFLMMIFMFGSILYPTLRNIKVLLPGEADLSTRISDVRGQDAAKATVLNQMQRLLDYADGNKLQKPSRGMVFEGKPGVGKTLLAKALAYEMSLPFVQADGSGLNSGVMGMAPLVIAYMRRKVETVAAPKEKGGWGGAIVFIDEGETLFGQRSGMQGGMQDRVIDSIWDMFTYDEFGVVSSCGLMYDTVEARERFWDLKQHEETIKHGIFMPMGMGGGGGAIYPLLTWIDGVNLPPFWSRFRVNKVNKLLSLFLPVTIGGKILRFAPAKPIDYNIVFITATNRPQMIDTAMRRPGRLGVSVQFDLPDVDARKDVAEFYAQKEIEKGLMNPNILERLQDFANMTNGTSPAEIQQIIEDAHDHRVELVNNLQRIKKKIDSGIKVEDLNELDGKYWRRWQKYVLSTEGWDDLRAEWYSLLEARSTVKFGKANPKAASDEHRKLTARHEFRGHFIQLFACMHKWQKPIVLTVMPRRNALGMVAHVELDERDPRPQEYYEGILRVCVGSTAAERFYNVSNQPGVSSDLENGTRTACFMVGKCAMRPYKCSEEEREKYREIGESLISRPDSGGMTAMMMSDPIQAFVGNVLSDKSAREKVAVFLGQAFVDSYRLIRANATVLNEIDAEGGRLLEIDEYAGNELEDLWTLLSEKLITFDKMSEENRTAWPDRLVNLENPLYAQQVPEYEEVRA